MTTSAGDALRANCILASASVRSMGLLKVDPDAPKAEGVRAVKVSKLTDVQEKRHRAIMGTQNDYRAALAKLSMPFGGREGWRIVPNALIPQALAAVTDAAKAFNIELAAAEEQFRSAYSVKLSMEPFANGFDGLQEPLRSKLTAHYERRATEALELAYLDTLTRLRNPVQMLHDRMVAASKRAERGTGREGVFRDSAVTNVTDLVACLPAFNVTGDERLHEIESILVRIRPNAELLRNDGGERDAVRNLCLDAISALDSYEA